MQIEKTVTSVRVQDGDDLDADTCNDDNIDAGGDDVDLLMCHVEPRQQGLFTVNLNPLTICPVGLRQQSYNDYDMNLKFNPNIKMGFPNSPA